LHRSLYSWPDIRHGTLRPEAHIRRFAVGLLALAAFAAAGLLLSRRKPPLPAATGEEERRPVEDLYAAGL
jgi:hypothetical protein